MNHRGFMLVELLIALMISSMLGVLLFNAFSQTNRSVRTTDAITNLSERSSVMRYIMDRDFSGACIPIEGLKKKPKSKQEEAQPKAPAQAQEPKKQPENEKKERKPISKIFYGVNKEGMLNTLTFITNNPVRSRIALARVVYRLVPEKSPDKRKPSYTLLRQEDGNLHFDAYALDIEKPIYAYELVSGVKKITVTYTAKITKERTEKKGNEEKKITETEYKAVNEWNLEERQPYVEGQPWQVIIPQAVYVEVVLWDERKERERTVAFKTMILPEMNEFEPEPKPTPKKKPEAEKKRQGVQQKAGIKGPAVSGKIQPKKMSSLDNTMLMLRRMLMADNSAHEPQGTKP